VPAKKNKLYGYRQARKDGPGKEVDELQNICPAISKRYSGQTKEK